MANNTPSIIFPEYKFKIKMFDIGLHRFKNGYLWRIPETHFKIDLLRTSYEMLKHVSPEDYLNHWQLFHLMLGINIPMSYDLFPDNYYRFLVAFDVINPEFWTMQNEIPINTTHCRSDTEHCGKCHCKCKKDYCDCLYNCKKKDVKKCLEKGKLELDSIPDDLNNICQEFNNIVTTNTAITIIEIINLLKGRIEFKSVVVFLLLYPFIKLVDCEDQYCRTDAENYINQFITSGVVTNNSAVDETFTAYEEIADNITDSSDFKFYIDTLIGRLSMAF